MCRTVALCCALALLAPIAPASAQARCPSRGVQYLVRSSQAIVFRLRGPSGISTYACRNRRSRPIRLDYPLASDQGLQRFSLRVAGHYVAFHTYYTDQSGDNSYEEVLRVDLSRAPAVITTNTFARRLPHPTAVGERLLTPRGVDGSYLGPSVIPPLLPGPLAFGLVLRRDGAFAWTASYQTIDLSAPEGQKVQLLTQVWKQNRGAAILLSQGRSVKEGVVGLSADRRSVTWVDNGQPRSAPL